MKHEIDSSNRIVIGELASKSYLTHEIARLTATQLMDQIVRASARKERDGWIAVLEDREGNILFYKTGYKNETVAKASTRKRSKQTNNNILIYYCRKTGYSNG